MMKRYKKTVVITLVSIVVIFLIVKNIIERRSFDDNSVYVIGHVDKINRAYQGVKIYVTYTYKGKIHKTSYITGNFENEKIGKKRYFIKIDSTNPDLIDLEYKIIVPDTLKKSPDNGWKSLPIKLY